MVDHLIIKKYSYPFADRINPKLYNLVDLYHNNDPIKGGGKRTNPNLHQQDNKEINILTRWINDLIINFSSNIRGGSSPYIPSCSGLGGGGGFDPYQSYIHSCWGVIYKKGDGVEKHNHFPYPISFCYYVKTPSHSSPIIIENKRMRVNEGQLILFLSHYDHYVPKSKVDGRCVIVGNINYRLEGGHV